jgi:DNA-binding beta-propeller fold protein YncE
MRKAFCALGFIYALLLCTLSGQDTATHWIMTGEIPLGGEGGWDYLAVNTAQRDLFITHGNHVLIYDLSTKKLVGSIDVAGAHGVAFAPELNQGFISDGGNGSVTIFDLTTLKPVQSVKVGENPDAICYDSRTKRVFAFNGRSNTASIIDAMTRQVVGELALPGKPEFAQDDGRGDVFDNIEDRGLVIKIDAGKPAIVAQWPLPAGSEPSALAMDVVNHRLFAGCHDKKLFVLNSDTGTVLATLPIGEGVDAAVYDPAGKHVFVSCGDGTLTVIRQDSPDKYSVEEQVKTEKGARTMAFDSSTQTAFLPIAKFGPPPAATPEHPHPHPSIVPNTLKLLIVEKRS